MEEEFNDEWTDGDWSSEQESSEEELPSNDDTSDKDSSSEGSINAYIPKRKLIRRKYNSSRFFECLFCGNTEATLEEELVVEKMDMKILHLLNMKWASRMAYPVCSSCSKTLLYLSSTLVRIMASRMENKGNKLARKCCICWRHPRELRILRNKVQTLMRINICLDNYKFNLTGNLRVCNRCIEFADKLEVFYLLYAMRETTFKVNQKRQNKKGSQDSLDNLDNLDNQDNQDNLDNQDNQDNQDNLDNQNSQGNQNSQDNQDSMETARTTKPSRTKRLRKK